MKFLRRFPQGTKQKPTAYSLVDIGRDTVKAVVALVKPDQPEVEIIGYGLAETGGHDITGGRLEAAAVTTPVNAALTQAEDSTEAVVGRKIVPDDVIFALAGRASVGQLFTVQQTRPKPQEPITAKELANLRARAERLVRQNLTHLPVEGGQWQALAVTDAGIRLDEHLVLEGLGLTGQELSLSVFGVAGHGGALRALQVLANRLDLEVANVVAAAQALAAVTPQAEAIIVDIGLSGTDICLIRDNALVAAGSTPFGGAFFTQAVAQALSVDLAEAEKLKRAFVANALPQEKAGQLEVYLDGPRCRWYDAVMDFLVGSVQGKPLPRKIYLTGGGSLLPGLDRLLRADPSLFQRAPEVTRLGAQALVAAKDLTQGLDYNLFGLALSLLVGLPD
jgi:cell division ATPase FtsA